MFSSTSGRLRKGIRATGGADFIGANFVHWTRERRPDVEIAILNALTHASDGTNLAPMRPDITFVGSAITDPALVDRLVAGTDVVVHFAAESHNDNSLNESTPFVLTSVMGTFTILEAVRRHDVRLHHVSTDEVYGDLELDDPKRFTEGPLFNPSSPYTSTMAASDLLVRVWLRPLGVLATLSNCSNSYGPH